MKEEFSSIAKSLENDYLFSTEALYQKNKSIYISRFQEHFSDTCARIVTLQQQGKLGEIAYLEYTMLYSNFINHNYIAEVRVYDDTWYFDKMQQVIGTFDVSFLFVYLEQLWNELLSVRKRYAGSVTSQEVTSFVIESFPKFYNYVVSSCRFGILPLIESEPFCLIKCMDEFELNIGSYMGTTEAIYKENRNKNREQFIEWFKERKEFDYAFEDFSGMDFSDLDLSEIDFRYSDLRNANLNHTDLQDSLLFGTRFCNADMEYVDLRYCLLYEADFTGANLKYANFTLAEANEGPLNHSEWEVVGFMGVSFRNANLEYANFTKASFLGADFTGASMTGAIFLAEQANQLQLSEEQRNVICLK